MADYKLQMRWDTCLTARSTHNFSSNIINFITLTSHSSNSKDPLSLLHKSQPFQLYLFKMQNLDSHLCACVLLVTSSHYIKFCLLTSDFRKSEDIRKSPVMPDNSWA